MKGGSTEEVDHAGIAPGTHEQLIATVEVVAEIQIAGSSSMLPLHRWHPARPASRRGGMPMAPCGGGLCARSLAAH
jgi:hypothetical protein